MAENDENRLLTKEIYDFIKVLYLEEEEKKIQLKEKCIKSQFCMNRYKREKAQYEAVNDKSLGFFNPNSNIIKEKIEHIEQAMEKLVIEQLEEEKSLKLVEERMNKIKVLRNILEEKEKSQKNSKLKEKKQEEKNTFAILKTHEAERQRIARDLHDTTVQNLTNLVHKTEFCTLLIDKEPIKVKLELTTMIERIKNIIEEMRDIICDLRPMSIDDLGLVATIQKYIKQLAYTHEEIIFDVSIKNEEKKLNSIINLTIFRVVQEACNNILKYAKASLVFISIVYKEDRIEILVEDDGIGFDYKKIIEKREGNKGLGISIMEERANLISGKLHIVSEEKKGTTIKLEVPFAN